jgi:hypothetical protein
MSHHYSLAPLPFPSAADAPADAAGQGVLAEKSGNAASPSARRLEHEAIWLFAPNPSKETNHAFKLF